MKEELMKFIDGSSAIDMDGTTEEDWMRLVQDCSLLGYDLNEAAQDWFGPDLIKEEPFLEYESQNIKGPHKDGGWKLVFRYLERCGNGIHSIRDPNYARKRDRTVLSYLELKQKDEPKLEFTLDF